ncbi:MAG: sigma-70 family RNA polymerase sigma factor [Myxococcales bacterium]
MDAAPEAADVAALVERARGVYPGFTVDPAAFAGHLGSCAKAAGGFTKVNAEDLYLAFASARGDREALAVIERRFLADVGRFIAHLRRQPSFVDEVRQQLRERLLIGSGAPVGGGPRILDYSGRGPLGAWIRVTATRQALDLIDKEKPHASAGEDPEEDQLAATVDPELMAIRERHLPQFRDAFRLALASLDARERNLLRFYLLDGLNIARIGEIFGKSRATIGRMVVECREKLLEETRRHLGALTRAPDGDVLSLIRLLQSQLDVSIRGFLRRGEPPA